MRCIMAHKRPKNQWIFPHSHTLLLSIPAQCPGPTMQCATPWPASFRIGRRFWPPLASHFWRPSRKMRHAWLGVKRYWSALAYLTCIYFIILIFFDLSDPEYQKHIWFQHVSTHMCVPISQNWWHQIPCAGVCTGGSCWWSQTKIGWVQGCQAILGLSL